MKTYEDALRYLDWLCVFGVKEGLERIRALADALGQPQNFYRTIHVAGTNGKNTRRKKFLVGAEDTAT